MSAGDKSAWLQNQLDRESAQNLLTEGPAPTWREGYADDEPTFRETVRAMGLPGIEEDGNAAEFELAELENEEGERDGADA